MLWSSFSAMVEKKVLSHLLSFLEMRVHPRRGDSCSGGQLGPWLAQASPKKPRLPSWPQEVPETGVAMATMGGGLSEDSRKGRAERGLSRTMHQHPDI